MKGTQQQLRARLVSRADLESCGALVSVSIILRAQATRLGERSAYHRRNRRSRPKRHHGELVSPLGYPFSSMVLERSPCSLSGLYECTGWR